MNIVPFFLRLTVVSGDIFHFGAKLLWRFWGQWDLPFGRCTVLLACDLSLLGRICKILHIRLQL